MSNTEASALLNEIAAMIEADLSITAGLASLEDRELGRIAHVARRLREKLQKGESLENATAAELESLDAPLVSILRTGISSADPVRSIRRFAEYLKRESQYHHQLIGAMIYPLVVVITGYTMLILSIRFMDQVGNISSGGEFWPPLWQSAAGALITYWYIPPLIGLVFWLIAWSGSGLGRMISGLTGFSHWGSMAMFCDLTAIQVENNVDPKDAIRLAAQATQNRNLIGAATEYEEALSRGSLPEKLDRVPPLLSWTLVNQQNGAALAGSLHRIGVAYHDRQSVRGRIATTLLPGALIAVVGGGMATFYLFAVLKPVYDTMFQWSEGMGF